jgi:hypothetical protein
MRPKYSCSLTGGRKEKDLLLPRTAVATGTLRMRNMLPNGAVCIRTQVYNHKAKVQQPGD